MSKIRIKMGEIEVDYEGSEEFLGKELPEFLEGISKLYKELHPLMPDANDEASSNTPTKKKKGPTLGTTATIAAKLSCNTGPDLLTAAAARLTLGLGRESFTRKELLAEAQTAKSYYNRSVSKNLSRYLQSLVQDDKLNEVSTDTYALTTKEHQRLEASLAN